MRPRAAARLLAAAAAVALLNGPAPLLGQQDAGAAAVPVAQGPSPLLPGGHWAVEAAWRAEALGLAQGFLPAQRSVPQHVVALALRRAAREADQSAPDLSPLARGWYARFLEEFPGYADAEDGGEQSTPLRLRSAAELGYDDRSGRVAPGLREKEFERTGALPLPDRSGLRAAVELAARGEHWAVELAPGVDAGGPHWERADVLAQWGPALFAAGRHPVGYGGGAGGTVILSGAAALDRVEAQTARPVRLPGWLRVLGPVSGHTFLSRLAEPRHEERDPYFWGASVALQPHPRFTAAVHRASMFGGIDMGDTVIDDVLNMLIGRVEGKGYENQQVSVGLRYRPPTERVLPLLAYLEWGSEDASGAWFNVPGVLAGVSVPALPGLPQWEVGAEYARFGASCCNNPPWYRHAGFEGSWASRGVALGHPLGGQGEQWLTFARASLLDARLRLDARAFGRERAGENLFVPGREGRSTGVAAALLWRFAPAADLVVDAARETGTGWTQSDVRAGARVFF